MANELGANPVTLSSALDSLRSGQLQRADAQCRQLLACAPEDPALHQLAAAIALELRDPVQATRWAQSSLALRPDHGPTLTLAGRAARLAGEREPAVAMFRRAATLAPDRAEAAFLLCVALLESGDAEATSHLPQLLRRFPNDANGWQMLGDALQGAQHAEAALVAYSRAAAVAPTASLHLRRAAVLQAMQRVDEAIEALRLAEHLAPERIDVVWKLAQCLRQASDLTGAQAALLRLVTLAPGAGEAWFTLGLIEQDRGRPIEAIALYRRSLQAQPNLAEAAVNLGICLQASGDLEAAKRSYGAALRMRADTFGRIAQALSAGPRGEVWLDHEALRCALSEAQGD